MLPIAREYFLIDPLHSLLNQISRLFSVLINIPASDLGRETELLRVLANTPFHMNVDAKMIKYKKTAPEVLASVCARLLIAP